MLLVSGCPLQLVDGSGLQSTCMPLPRQLADEVPLCCREGEECGVSHEGCGDQQERCAPALPHKSGRQLHDWQKGLSLLQ